MKKCYLILIVCFWFLLASCFDNRTAEYKEMYFSNKDSYIEIEELIVNKYKSNNLNGRISIWCSKENPNVFYDDKLQNESTVNVNDIFSEDELLKIYNFIHGSIHECVIFDGEFIEFGDSTGAKSIYLSLNNKKPKPISSSHKIYDFDDGWYFSTSTAR